MENVSRVAMVLYNEEFVCMSFSNIACQDVGRQNSIPKDRHAQKKGKQRTGHRHTDKMDTTEDRDKEKVV